MEAGEQVAQELRPAVSPEIRAFFDEATNSVSYLVADPATRAAAAIDPVLGFDPVSGRIDHEGADRILSAAEEGADEGLQGVRSAGARAQDHGRSIDLSLSS